MGVALRIPNFKLLSMRYTKFAQLTTGAVSERKRAYKTHQNQEIDVFFNMKISLFLFWDLSKTSRERLEGPKVVSPGPITLGPLVGPKPVHNSYKG
jgi:hypothetical protein